MNVKRVVFCDFDGTITVAETFVAVLKRYTPDLSAELIPQIYTLQLTLREGVRRMLESIPSQVYPEILEFVRSQPLRPGLAEFLAFLHRQNVPCVVISGGLQGMVAAALAPYQSQIQAIYGVAVDTGGDRLQITSPAEGETDFVDKVALMQRHPARETIVIGDSVTDLNMALAADVVFARDRLAQYMEERGKAYDSWADFYDIRDRLVQRWEAVN
ncbi:MAG: HAD-IB family phosphatase [Thermosynechococcaceae cyanobacterium]